VVPRRRRRNSASPAAATAAPVRQGTGLVGSAPWALHPDFVMGVPLLVLPLLLLLLVTTGGGRWHSLVPWTSTQS
jgi:hypothetical protein